jgi:hypothetical protein
MTVAAKLDLALKLLDEVDSTSLGQINAKLDRITDAVAAARRELDASPEVAVRELSREPIGASA